MGGLPANRTVNGSAVDPKTPTLIDVAMGDGLFTSTDAGETWKSGGAELKSLAAVAVNPKRPHEVSGASTDGVIFKSTDGGMTWQRQR